MKAPNQTVAPLRTTAQEALHNHEMRNVGYQDALDDFKECIKVVGYCNGAALFWLEHGRNWKEHL